MPDLVGEVNGLVHDELSSKPEELQIGIKNDLTEISDILNRRINMEKSDLNEKEESDVVPEGQKEGNHSEEAEATAGPESVNAFEGFQANPSDAMNKKIADLRRILATCKLNASIGRERGQELRQEIFEHRKLRRLSTAAEDTQTSCAIEEEIPDYLPDLPSSTPRRWLRSSGAIERDLKFTPSEIHLKKNAKISTVQ